MLPASVVTLMLAAINEKYRLHVVSASVVTLMLAVLNVKKKKKFQSWKL
jgi:hypothetical protein